MHCLAFFFLSFCLFLYFRYFYETEWNFKFWTAENLTLYEVSHVQVLCRSLQNNKCLSKIWLFNTRLWLPTFIWFTHRGDCCLIGSCLQNPPQILIIHLNPRRKSRGFLHHTLHNLKSIQTFTWLGYLITLCQ